MQFNFFKDYFGTKAKFIHKPNLIEEYTEDDVVFYSMDSDLIFWNGKKQIVINAVNGNGVFYTNLITYPKFIKIIADKLGINLLREKMIYGAVGHDGMYSNPNFFQRVYADWMMLLMFKVEGENIFIRWIAFFMVRLLGSKYRN